MSETAKEWDEWVEREELKRVQSGNIECVNGLIEFQRFACAKLDRLEQRMDRFERHMYELLLAHGDKDA